MHLLDYAILFAYLLAMLGVGYYFMRRQDSVDEYFVGGRNMGAGHVGLSVVATDVGGGFSIGLGGLGFVMGISASWLLFTGLLGAWLSAVLVVPRIKKLEETHKFLTFPDYLEMRFDSRTKMVAALVSGIGYAGFVGSQILAGGKLSSAAFNIDLVTAVIVMGVVAVVYTAFGGIKAVIYTDTVQWILLFSGLLFVALPLAWVQAGGWAVISRELPDEFFSLANVSISELASWALSIVPIWFIGMTLYQRIYACRDVKTAKRAWYFAGLLEWPLMAFTGAILGMLARVMFTDVEPEMGLPLLIRDVLPIGVTGLIISAYFSAIMSTADSCLLASTSNFVNDIYQRHINPQAEDKRVVIISRITATVIGLSSIAIALIVPKVLDAILLAYSFMVSGLFAPTVAGLLWKKTTAQAAFWSIIFGGGSALLFAVFPGLCPVSEPIFISLPISAVVLFGVIWLAPSTKGG